MPLIIVVLPDKARTHSSIETNRPASAGNFCNAQPRLLLLFRTMLSQAIYFGLPRRCRTVSAGSTIHYADTWTLVETTDLQVLDAMLFSSACLRGWAVCVICQTIWHYQKICAVLFQSVIAGLQGVRKLPA